MKMSSTTSAHLVPISLFTSSVKSMRKGLLIAFYLSSVVNGPRVAFSARYYELVDMRSTRWACMASVSHILFPRPRRLFI